MINENPKTEKIKEVRAYILEQAERHAEMLGEDQSAVEKIVEGKQSLVDSGLFDSLSFLDLVSALEERFDIEIDLTGYDLEYFVTLEGLSIVAAEADSKAIAQTKANIISSKSAQGINLEEITPQHPCWHELMPMFDALYEYMERFNLMVKLKPNGAELWLKSLENVVGKTSIIIGAVDDGKLVGYFHGALKILPIYLKGGYIGVLMSMFVLPEYRKQRIADEMYERVYEWLTSHEISSIETQPMVNNRLVTEYWMARGYEKEIIQLRKMLPKNGAV